MTGEHHSHAMRQAPSRTLALVNAPADAVPTPDLDVVVLDTSWSPDPDDPLQRIPLRTALLDILDEENLFVHSLRLIDPWADASGMPALFARDGVTWWFHARSFLRLDLQELLLWIRVLDRLAPPGRYATILVPTDRPRLAEAARARGRAATVRKIAGTPFDGSDITGRPEADHQQRASGSGRVEASRRRALASTIAGMLGRRRAGSVEAREQLLRERVARLTATGAPLLAIVRVASYHHVDTDEGARRRDPYIGPVAAALEGAGRGVALLSVHTTHRKRRDWLAISDDPDLIPQSYLRLIEDDEAGARLARYQEEFEERLGAMPSVPLVDRGYDLGPAMRALTGRLGPWAAGQWRDLDRAGTLMDALEPCALLTGWEAARTSWLAAARARGIPSVAIQHGVIYPDTPDYCRPASPLLVRPNVTCVYGAYEKAILTGMGGYRDDEVLVTGSPRVDPDAFNLGPMEDGDRAAVRASLGVDPADRMLVLSGGRMTIGDRLGTLPLLGRVLDGPLPGVHLVVKLHPEEPDGEHYRRLFEGLARAGGYTGAPITVVRDIDLFRLLRAADAHLGVLSTVLTDSVLAGTPNLIVAGQAQADLIGYVDAGVAVPVTTVDDVRAWMASPVPLDPDARRRFIAGHYLGGDATARVVDAIATVTATAHGRS